ncbi:hypothetical protein [Coleofasciculus sp. E1-EBD-02]|uniref:hypothetical protein n=1 Tax=Coleofasciculus sp. E1-EBD-02 TaxID=3068481 RepID=UPI0032FDD179
MRYLPPQFDTCYTAETTAQQRLEDVGVTQLLSHLKHYSDIDFDASQMHLTDAEVNILAKLFIQQLTQSLNGKLIAGALNTLRHGKEIEEMTPHSVGVGLVTSGETRNDSCETRPYTRLNTFPTPRYQEGDRVQWKTPNPDWGVILGRFYEYNHDCDQWTICYLIELAPDSPSAAWITADMAWEEDLEKMPDIVAASEENGYSYLYSSQSRRAIAPPSLHSPRGRYNTHYPHQPRPITRREQYIIDLYCYCELGMTPRDFYAKWDVTYEQISHICDRSLGTVQCWFNRGQGHRPPKPVDLRHLAIMDFLLEHFEEIPEKLRTILCSP